MPNALLVDTNFSAYPIYQFLIEQGINVYVVGGKPDDALAKSNDNYIELDYSNTAEMVKLIKALDIDYLIPGCNDLSYKVCAAINDKIPFHGIDTPTSTEIINNKQAFRNFAKETGLPSPEVVNKTRAIDHPIIVKPTDSFSGRGITVINEPCEKALANAIEKARQESRSNSYVVESFWEGQLFSHSAFIEKDEIVQDFVVREDSTASRFAVDTSRVEADFSAQLLKKIRQAIVNITKKLDLVDGLIHTQFIRRNDDIAIIEVTRRCPGDLYSLLIEHSTGFPYAEAYASPFISLKVSDVIPPSRRQWIMRHTISTPLPTRMNNIKFLTQVGIEQLVPLAITGQLIEESPRGRIAILFTNSDSEQSLEALYNRTLSRKLYTVN